MARERRGGGELLRREPAHPGHAGEDAPERDPARVEQSHPAGHRRDGRIRGHHPHRSHRPARERPVSGRREGVQPAAQEGDAHGALQRSLFRGVPERIEDRDRLDRDHPQPRSVQGRLLRGLPAVARNVVGLAGAQLGLVRRALLPAPQVVRPRHPRDHPAVGERHNHARDFGLAVRVPGRLGYSRHTRQRAHGSVHRLPDHLRIAGGSGMDRPGIPADRTV